LDARKKQKKGAYPSPHPAASQTKLAAIYIQPVYLFIYFSPPNEHAECWDRETYIGYERGAGLALSLFMALSMGLGRESPWTFVRGGGEIKRCGLVGRKFWGGRDANGFVGEKGQRAWVLMFAEVGGKRVRL
jgi:hypothetical protein